MSASFPPSGVRVLSVGDLTRSVKELLEEHHGDVWVEGEVSNLARPASGHQYLTLKDEDAPLKAVVYRGIALRLKFDLRDGMHIIARGRLTVYEPRGEYQLLIEELQPKGVGPLELAFRQLKEKLSLLGYFEPRRKRPLPRMPQRVALITSATGSAIRDMLEVFARRWPAVEAWVCPVRVQGDEAAPEIAAMIGLLNRVSGPGSVRPVDVLVLARGGGSLEDLWPFNEEIVAHAIFRSMVPVVTGIGHEDDLTIADLVADRRSLTPTEAAERLVPDRAEMLATLEDSAGRLRSLLARRLELARSRLEQLADRPCLRRPVENIRLRERRVDELAERMHRAMARSVERGRQRLQAAVGKLEGLSPLAVLSRGYSVTRRLEDLRVVQGTDEVGQGDWLVTRVCRARIISRVESVSPEENP